MSLKYDKVSKKSDYKTNRLISLLGLIILVLFYTETIFAIKINLFTCPRNGLPSISKVVTVSDSSLFSIEPSSQSEIIFTIKHRFSDGKINFGRVGMAPAHKERETDKTLFNNQPGPLPYMSYMCDKYDYDHNLENCIAVKYFRNNCDPEDMLAVFISKMFDDDVLKEIVKQAYLKQTHKVSATRDNR